MVNYGFVKSQGHLNMGFLTFKNQILVTLSLSHREK